jgi:hypothetical protein
MRPPKASYSREAEKAWRDAYWLVIARGHDATEESSGALDLTYAARFQSDAAHDLAFRDDDPEVLVE